VKKGRAKGGRSLLVTVLEDFPLMCQLVQLLLVPLIARAASSYDAVVYGSTPAGIAAAVLAARSNLTVLLVCPHSRVGGMSSGGLGWDE
jgi:NADPH-dependent 2,4-dienoyl-CoA reductase/sulfur reductase-like enzyme